MRESIVLPAWKVASESATIKKLNFLPSLLATAYLSCIILYQVAWSYVNVFHLKDRFFSLVIEFAHASYFMETMITVGILFVIYLLVNPIAEGGLIYLISHKDSGDPWDKPLIRALSVGLRSFLPIFEAHNLLAPFKLLAIITEYLFLLRIFGKDYAVAISAIMAAYLALSLVVNVMFAYTRFFIVFENDRAFQAMGKSVRMTLENLDVTFRLYFTLVVVYVRTLLTVVAFIVFPFIVSAILTYVTIGFLQTVAVAVIGIAVLGFLGFVSHLNSVLEIFVEALWYRAWKDNRDRTPAADGYGHDGHDGHDDHGGHGDSHGHDDHGHH